MSARSAANAYVAGLILGIPMFLVAAKLFIWGVPALRAALDGLL